MKQTLSLIGTGKLGSALARALLAQGHTTTVYNRTREKSEALRAHGAHVADTVAAALQASDVVFVNVSNYQVGDQLLRSDEAARALRGRLLVELTTGSPAQARQRARWAHDHGIRYLDGAVMATPDLIGLPHGTILYAGDGAEYRAVEDVLRAFGGNPVYVGSDPGHAAALDLAILVQMYGALFGSLAGVAICQAEELSLDSYAGYLQAFAPIVQGGVTDLVLRTRDTRFADDGSVPASLEIHHGAIQQWLALCAERSLASAIPRAFDELFVAARAAGHDKDDLAVLTRFMRASAS